MIVQCEMDITQRTGRGWYGGQSKAVELPWMLLTQFKLPPTNFFVIVIYKIYLRRRTCTTYYHYHCHYYQHYYYHYLSLYLRRRTCTTSTRRWQRRRQQQLPHLQVKDSQRTHGSNPLTSPKENSHMPPTLKIYTSWHTSELEYPQRVPPEKCSATRYYSGWHKYKLSITR